MNNINKCVVGMSGGVDSSVAAHILLESGVDVIGVTMRTWKYRQDIVPSIVGYIDINETDGICIEDAITYNDESYIEDAAKVAYKLGIKHYVVDATDIFKEKVVMPFIKEYEMCRTPNPCVICNREIKWQALLSWAAGMDIDYVATGHYASIIELSGERRSIAMACDISKDQTYALYRLTQDQLSRTIMPLGAYSKTYIRDIARKIGLHVSDKRDSQEICFLPNGDYAGFVRQYSSGEANSPGNFIDQEGNIIGTHRGLIHYTIGQRKGLGLSLGYPAFVSELRRDTNEVVVGVDKDIYSDKLICGSINVMAEDIESMSNIELRSLICKIRYGHKGTSCKVSIVGNKIVCVFDEPVRAITPGQSAVFYQDGHIWGGGIIEDKTT